MCCSCGGADSRARHCTGETNGPSLKWQMPPNCHCEERSDVAISQYPAESQESYRRNRNCLPEIAPQGHFLALRAQGATSACGLLAMTNFWSSRFTGSHYGTTVRHGASRTPLPCNAPFLIPPAWAGEWSGRSHDPSPPASSPPGCPHCGRARGCGSRCSGTAAHPAR